MPDTFETRTSARMPRGPTPRKERRARIFGNDNKEKQPHGPKQNILGRL